MSNSETVDVRYYYGGAFEKNDKGEISYVGGILSLKFGIYCDTYTYGNVLETGLSLMGSLSFEAYYKLKGRCFNTGFKKLESEKGMIDYLKSKDSDNHLDLYFVKANSREFDEGPIEQLNLHTRASPRTKNASFLSHQLEDHHFVSIRRSPRTMNNPHTLNTFNVSPLKRGEKLVPRRKLSTLFEKGAGLNGGGNRRDDVREGKQSWKKRGGRVVLEEIVPNTKQMGKCNEKKLMSFEKGKDKPTEEVDDFGDEFGAESEDDSGYWSEDSAFSAVEFGDNEVEGDVVENEDLFSDFVDEALLKAVNNGLNQSWSKSKTSVQRAASNSYLFNVDDVEVNVSVEADLDLDDDNRSVVGSDDESSPNNLIFDPNVDFGKPIVLKKGLKFPSVQDFRKAVRQHAVENGYEPYFLHNESRRVNIQCRYRCECPWNSKRARLPKCSCGATIKCEYRIYATLSKDDGLTFEIKSLNLEHVCSYTTRNRMVSSEFIAEKYLEVWRSDPHWSLQGTQSRVKLDLGVDVVCKHLGTIF